MGLFEGVRLYILAGVVEIDTDPDFCPKAFQQALDLVGACGLTDYQIFYDPATGVETYRFPILQEAPEPPVVQAGPRERVPLFYRIYEAAAWTEQYVQEIGMRHTVRLVGLALHATGHGG